MTDHMMKLVVGFDSLEQFAQWQARERMMYEGQEVNIVRTRYAPKQADEMVKNGASIYRVIKNKLVCRQKLLGFEPFEDPDKGTRTMILTDTEIMCVKPRPRRPFQGWRYLKAADAPRDIGLHVLGQDKPQSTIEIELMELGLI